jgi:hypothetical protein
MQNQSLFLSVAAALGALSSWIASADVFVHLEADERRPGAACPRGFTTEADNVGLADLVKNWSFRPDCVWDTLRADARDEAGRVRGFAFGVNGGFSRGVGYTVGNEVVVMRAGRDALTVGVVAYRTVGLDVTLPVGASATQSVIFGGCEQGFESYLGFFENYSLAAKTLSLGRRQIIPFVRELTGCNAHTSTLGLTTSLAGIGTSYYWPISERVTLQGPGVQPMLEYLDELNR